ncbi:MAG: hypothetical protein QW505_02260 [Thermoplasmata archaeon]
MDSAKDLRGPLPTPTEMVAFAREYLRSYFDTAEEKSPNNLPPMAQQSPYNVDICLLPNGCYAMLLVGSREMKIKASFKNWDEIQDLVIKGVDFFIGFYPHEMRGIGDWKKRGRRDAIRDIRLMSDSELSQAAGNLSMAIEDMTRLAATNPTLAEQAKEHVQLLRDIEDKLRRRGFAPVDVIATLQDLKAYKPTYERMIIEYPDKAIMEKILEGVEELMSLQQRMDSLESRMFEVERLSAIKKPETDEIPELKERLGKLEGHLEKVSNILHLLNSKVEKYFTQTAEAEKLARIEVKVAETSKRIDALMEAVAKVQSKQEAMGSELTKEISKMRAELETARKKVKRLESHFISFAKSVEE